MKYFLIAFLVPFLASTALTYISVTSGQTPWLRGTWVSAGTVLVIAVGILIAGFCVLAYKKGKLDLDVLLSARIYMFGVAGAISGLALLGLWGGCMLGEFPIWSIVLAGFTAEHLAVISALALILCSSVTIWNCRVHKDDGDASAKSSAPA